MKEYEVIVIGAGMGGGIPAATYLQKAGARVLLLEANQEVGTHIKTNEFWPGVLNTPCAAGSFVGNSPAWDDLNLEDYGVTLRLGPRGTGCTFPNHKNLFIAPYDIEGTCNDIAKFSEKDAKRAGPILQRVLESVVEINELMFYSIPTPEKLETMYEKLAEVWGVRVEDFAEMNAFELINTTFESDEVKQTFMCVAGAQTTGDIGIKGQGAFSVPSWMFVIPGQLVGGNHALAHAMIRIFLEHGGTLWRNCPVEKILVEDGVATGVRISKAAVMHPGEQINAKSAIVSNVGARKSLELIGEDIMKIADSMLAMRMKHFDMASRASNVTTWILKGLPKWKSLEWNPIISKQHFFYKGWDSIEACKEWYMAQRNGDTWKAFGGFGEIVIHAALDPTQASPEGYVALRYEEVLPFWWREEGSAPNPEKWDEAKKVMVEKRTDMWETLAPGFKKQLLDVHDVTPLDLWRGNAAAEYGNGIGGAYIGSQWMFERMPYRMPIRKLYSSNCVWPLSLSWMATGYNAACAVAEDMGIRKQHWWIHRPCEWTLKNAGRLIVQSNPFWVD